MPATKLARLFGRVLVRAWLSTATLAAADPSPESAAPPPPVAGEVKHEGGPGLRPARRAYVTAGTNQFAFLVPADLRVDGDPAQGNFVLSSNDGTYYFTFRILGPPPPAAGESASEACRELLLSSYPGGEIREEFSLAAANQSGPAFDLQWRSPNATLQSIRVAFIPSAAGMLEFTLTALPAKFPEAQSPFNTLLLTFRSNEKGPLEDTPLPNQI